MGDPVGEIVAMVKRSFLSRRVCGLHFVNFFNFDLKGHLVVSALLARLGMNNSDDRDFRRCPFF
jgi:hypothetical protein